jgi:DNA-nicking Smr family endonuclease
MPRPEDPRDADPIGGDESAHELPIEEILDLHAFAPAEIPEVVHDYLDQAQARGFREVRVIHGRGIGFQRDRVRRVLERHPAVEAYADAPAERGHWGATIIRLRPPAAGDKEPAAPAST